MNRQEILKIFQVEAKNIDKYEKYDEDSSKTLDGVHDKEFVRADKEIFKELLEVKNKGKFDSYITYIDSIRREGDAPEKLTTLKKNMFGMLAPTREVIASRLLNYFDCPTAYNIGVKDSEEFIVYSLDFISQDETFEILYRLVNTNENRIYVIWPLLEDYFKKSFLANSPTFEEDLLKFKNDYFKSHFIREFIICDRDTGIHNFGILSNEKTNGFKFVNFDYESSFGVQKYKNDHFNFEYMLRKQPDLIKEIYEKCTALRDVLKNNKKPFSKNSKIEESIQQNVKNLLTNIDNFIEKYENHLQSSLKLT